MGMDNYKDFGAIITALGGPAKLGKSMDVDTCIVANWRARGNIPAPYWVDLMDAIKRHNAYVKKDKIKGVNYTLLAEFASKRKPVNY